MIPIHELLNRIRWDRDFGKAEFVISYYDRQTGENLRVSFTELSFSEEDHFGFSLVDREGVVHHIPYHRVREVFRDGERIWHRNA